MLGYTGSRRSLLKAVRVSVLVDCTCEFASFASFVSFLGLLSVITLLFRGLGKALA